MIFYQSCFKSFMKHTKPIIQIGHRLRILEKKYFVSKRIQATVYSRKTSKMINIKKETRNKIIKDLKEEKKSWTFDEKSCVNVQIKKESFFKLNFHRPVVMDFFSVVLVFKASFNCYPYKII